MTNRAPSFYITLVVKVSKLNWHINTLLFYVSHIICISASAKIEWMFVYMPIYVDFMCRCFFISLISPCDIPCSEIYFEATYIIVDIDLMHLEQTKIMIKCSNNIICFESNCNLLLSWINHLIRYLHSYCFSTASCP